MFSGLILLLVLFSANLTHAQFEDELIEYTQSPAWKKYLYFDDEKSLLLGERYFIGKDPTDPYLELKKSIEVFKLKQKNIEGEYFQCLFPARFKMLKGRWPDLFENILCSEYEEFRKGIDIENVYLVFTSAYPNNPASMFGHTFLRFDRKSVGHLKSSKEILGYSAAFQARTNPNDNPVMYTLKGIFGGYQSYLEIKPQYINIGVYNNGESRDTWEFKLDLTSEEIDFLIAHMWELSISGALPYYFFDENCSTHLIRLLEVVRPSLNFKSKSEVFVVPQVTYREIALKLANKESSDYRPSLKRRIKNQYENLSKPERARFHENKRDLKALNKETSIKVLESLGGYWKLKNYNVGTRLNSDQKQLMYQTLLVRSKLNTSSPGHESIYPSEENPLLGTKLSRVGFGLNQDLLSLNMRYGFHSFDDFEQGFDGNSFIKLFDSDFVKIKSQNFYHIDLIDILSLQDFNFLFRDLSWRVRLTHEGGDKSILSFQGGIGLSHLTSSRVQFYSLIGTTYFSDLSEKLLVHLNTGLKIALWESVRLTSQGHFYSSDLGPLWENKLTYFMGDFSHYFSYRKSRVLDNYQLGISYNW